MPTFSIKDIEAVSGIRSHTLRIWEQRYGIILPKRSETNIRYYDDSDLKNILNISILNKHGYKISAIAKMNKSQMSELILSISGNQITSDSHIKQLVSAMLTFDEHLFHNVVSKSILQIGLEKTMMGVVFPFLNEVGMLWQVGSIHPSHEHFASNIIKQKLYVAIDGHIGKYAPNKKRFLLFLPENERHSMGLLFANYILRSRGQEVLFLDQEVPLNDFKDAMSMHKPDYIFTILTASHVTVNKQEFVNTLANTWKETSILLSGFQFMNHDIQLPSNVSVVKKMEDFIALADRLSKNEN
jgi:DNA-binding transcriptional MerR regulator